MRNPVYSMSMFIVVGAILVVQSLRALLVTGDVVQMTYLQLCFGAAGLVVGALGLFRRLKGKILLQIRRSLPLNGGELTFHEPTYLYELWLFCEVPFSRYH